MTQSDVTKFLIIGEGLSLFQSFAPLALSLYFSGIRINSLTMSIAEVRGKNRQFEVWEACSCYMEASIGGLGKGLRKWKYTPPNFFIFLICTVHCHHTGAVLVACYW